VAELQDGGLQAGAATHIEASGRLADGGGLQLAVPAGGAVRGEGGGAEAEGAPGPLPPLLGLRLAQLLPVPLYRGASRRLQTRLQAGE
jgi:hypothetical protein